MTQLGKKQPRKEHPEPCQHYDPESSKQLARKLLQDLGLTREDLLKIPRHRPLSDSEITRHQK